VPPQRRSARRADVARSTAGGELDLLSPRSVRSVRADR